MDVAVPVVGDSFFGIMVVGNAGSGIMIGPYKTACFIVGETIGVLAAAVVARAPFADISVIGGRSVFYRIIISQLLRIESDSVFCNGLFCLPTLEIISKGFGYSVSIYFAGQLA